MSQGIGGGLVLVYTRIIMSDNKSVYVNILVQLFFLGGGPVFE